MYFNISTDIVDRLDLTIEEKMACVVLARYANKQAFEGLITLDVIAKKIGISRAKTERVLQSLQQKGLVDAQRQFDETDDERPVAATRPDSVAPAPVTEHYSDDGDEALTDDTLTAATAPRVEDVAFEQLDSEVTPRASADELAAIFDEIVPRNRLTILYGLADQNIDKLKAAYREVKKTHKYDVIDALAEYLQTAPDQQAIDQVEEKAMEYDEAKKLLDILKEEVEPDEIIQAGQKLNRQINIGRVQSIYKSKLKK